MDTRRGVQSEKGYKTLTAHKKKPDKAETPKDDEHKKNKGRSAASSDHDGFKYKSGEQKSEVDVLDQDFITA